MTPPRKHRNRHFSILFTLFFLLGLLPQPLRAETLRIVYGNDNLGELAPCG